MSILFPVKYESQNNSSIIKYYQSNADSTTKLETDVCLKNILQQNNQEVISNLDKIMYPVAGNSNVVSEPIYFSQNLIINDDNCSISNPTTICISSSFMQQPIDLINQVFTNTIGTNTFNGESNTISMSIQLLPENSPIFDTDLIITATNPLNLFNSRNNTWTALFDENNENVLIQKAVNSELTNQTNQSLLTISEDIFFNNNYALGKEQLSYYTKNSITNKIEIHNINNSNLLATNNINISVNANKINSNSFGSYKIVQPKSSVAITYSNTTIGTNYVIGTTVLKEIITLGQYVELFDDISENNGFKIQMSTVNINSGLNFTTSSNSSYFEIDNSTMINNNSFMENIVFPKKSISVEITQNAMTITANAEETTPAYTANNNEFTLTSKGEQLNSTSYNTNGEIHLEIISKTNRTLITNSTDIASETSLIFPQISVDYDTITNELKTNKYVNYEIENVIVPTGLEAYGSLICDNIDGSSLFTSTSSKNGANMTITSNIESIDDEIVLIKIMPQINLISNSNSNRLYILNSDETAADIAIDETIDIEINGDITVLKEKDDLRFTLFPKKITDLKISYSGDSNGNNNIKTYDSSLTDLAISNSNKNGWCIGYSDNTGYLKSDSIAFTYSAEIFPSVDDYIYICNNNANFSINIEYIINSFNTDQINITYDSYPQTTPITPSAITGKENINQKNINILSVKYKNTNKIAFKNGNHYDQIEVTTIKSYNVSFKLSLAGFINISIMTPVTCSTEISYEYYLRTNNLDNTIVITNDNKTIAVTNSNGPVTSSIFSTIIIKDSTSNQNITYKPITTITLNSDKMSQLKTLLSINKDSITPLNGQMQYRNKIDSNTYGDWSTIGPIVENIEPYYGTEPLKNINDYEININIYPRNNNDISFNETAYFIPIILDNTTTSSLATGYKYDIKTITSKILNFDPTTYITNDLIVGDQLLNLSSIVTYSNPDATEGNQTYKATMSIFNTIGGTKTEIATINTDKTSFTAPIVLAKCKKNLFKVLKTFNSTESTAPTSVSAAYTSLITIKTNSLGGAITDNLLRLVISNTNVGQNYFYTRLTVNDPWSEPNYFGNTHQNFVCTMTPDGSKLIISSSSISADAYVWNGSTYIFTQTITFADSNPTSNLFTGINITSNGLRIVVSLENDYIYHSSWNSTSSSYDPFILSPNSSFSTQQQLGMTNDGSMISYGDNTHVGVSFWDNLTSSYGPRVYSPSSDIIKMYINSCFNSDGSIMFISVTNGIYYAFFDKDKQNFGEFTLMTITPPMPIIGKFNMFTMTHDGLHLIASPTYINPNIALISLTYMGGIIAGSNVKGSNVTGAIPTYICGVNAINDNLSGSIDLLDGVTVNYKNIKKTNYVDFSLKPDNIVVNLTGPTITAPQKITSLTYSTLNSEEISIPFYRGYATDDQAITKIYKYTINRKDLVSYVINVDADFSSNIFTNIFRNSQNTISFNNGIGSIGTTIKSLFSRLPTTSLTLNKLNMPITISSDSVTITRTSSVTGISSSITKLLQDYELYTFVNGEILKSLNLRANWSSPNTSDYYFLNHGKANMLVYYNNSYIGNPQDITVQDWGTKISEVGFSDAKNGFTLTEIGLDNDGFLTVTVNDDIVTDSVSFYIIAEPQMSASQLAMDGAKIFPFDTTDARVYDASKLITTYFPITSVGNTGYKPFETIASLNNVTFTSINKEFIDYNNIGKNNGVIDFIISGSTIKIQEVKSDGSPSLSGPDGNGVIFDGFTSDIIKTTYTPDNKYYDYINVDSLVLNSNTLNLSYTQENKQYFETVFIDTNIKPVNNIKFSISGYFIGNNVPSYKLISSTTKGIKTNIYDMIKRESDIVLLKYECLYIDFTNIPANTTIHKINFIPTKVYTSIVTIPPIVQFGSKYLDKFNAITASNMNIDGSGNIVWTEIDSPVLLKNFSLTITAVNQKGLNNIIELLYATSEIPVNFSAIYQTNAMEILATDGTPKFIITPFGQILTPNINVNAVTFFNPLSNSNIDLIRSNSTIFSP